MLDKINIDIVAISIKIPEFLQGRFGFGETFDIYWYGVIIVFGIVLGSWWGVRELAKRDSRTRVIDEFGNGVVVAVFAGYFFARLTYVVLDILDGRKYETVGEILNVRAGGVNILGGFVGAAVVGWLYLRWRDLPAWHYADIAGPTLLLAQSIGRWANFVNQELYGPPTDLPWGILIDPKNRLMEHFSLPLETRFHPTFLYESIALFIGFLLLVFLTNRYRDVWQPGTLFGIFLVWWGGNRAWIELFRPDQTTVGDSFITYSMLISIMLALVGVYVILARNDKLPNSRKRPSKPKRRTA